ncbi:HEAT repeat-containing protein 6, partial [Stegodyphus mimosarum]
MEDKAVESRIQEYSTKLKNLKVTDANELNKLVDQINELNANSACFENKVTEDMLLNIAKLIPPGNDHIISKFSSLIYFLIIKQKVVLHATCIESLSAFMISAIRMSGEWVLNDLLIALSALLSGNTDKVVTLHENLIGKNGVLVQLLIPSKFDKSVHFNAFNC